VGSTIGLVFLILLVVAVLAWIVGRPRATAGSDRDQEDDIDREVLGQAEDEVRDLDTFTSPDDADDDLPDWGPGAPKP
jgi:hypothetical protein